ncbi:MAG: hypothetical protein U1E70_15840 [Acetobacteraceae bacterium]|nr:hypothetical protein [Pseudomonadota bacterium]
MQSSNNTLIGRNGSITDAAGNVWTITATGQVAVNGVVDSSTRNVTHLAYVNGLVWQENSLNLWWSKSAPSAAWSPPQGTSLVPVPVPNAARDNAVIGAAAPGTSTPVLTDTHGNTWALANGRVVVNGVADMTTANVIELAWRNGRIWQENSQHLWWSKDAPAASWSPGAGSATNPVSGNFYVYNAPGQAAVINVGVLTTSPEGGSGMPPGSVSRIITPGVTANGSAIHVSTQTATIEVDGPSALRNGADLTLIGAYRTPRPVYGPMENNGAMMLDHASLHVGGLSGTGTVTATNGSVLAIQGAEDDGAIVRLRASDLYIGGQGGAYGSAGIPGGMSFLAPIDMDAGSRIVLNAVQATSGVLNMHAGSVSELILYNGATEVADIAVHGVATLHAANTGTGASMAIVLSAMPTAHDLPLITHQV